MNQDSIGAGLFSMYRDGWDNVSKVTRDWMNVFFDVCVDWFGMNEHSANVLFDEMCRGNWSHLHQTESEQKYSADEWFNKFVTDVFYCCDRWSVDRLMRTHWLYRQWIEAVNRKEIEPCLY